MRFTTGFSLPAERERLFAFHEDPWNLRVLLEGWELTRVLATAGHIRPGARTEILERFGPLELHLVFEHFLLEPPERFGERLVRGPFRRFEHIHVFRAARPDPAAGPRAEIEERIEVELPPRLGGEPAARLFVLQAQALLRVPPPRLRAPGGGRPVRPGGGAAPVTPRTVVVLGGSGIFGGRIARALAETAGLRVVLAGRNAALGSEAAARMGADFLPCDLRRTGALRGCLDRAQAALLIHAAGPFQGQRYDVAETCLAAGVHYLDIADARDFVCGIGALDAVARARGLSVGSGASSVPTITHALVAELAAELERIDVLQIALSPGNQNPRGASTIAAVLGNLGRSQRVWDGGRWTRVPCWGDKRRLDFPPRVGSRAVYACDVPDLELFPRTFGARTVRFHAGLELGVLNAALSALRALRAARLVPPLAPLAPLALRASLALYSRGSKNGALAVWARGTPRGQARGGHAIERRIALVTGDDGPATPSSPAILLARKLLLGDGLPAGAYPCLGLLRLGELLEHLEPLGIRCARGDGGAWT